MDSDTDRLLVPYDEAMRKLGDIGRTTLYELFARRELIRVNIGRRGFVTAKSLAAYVNRLSEAASA
ncbi:helix-turn-helix domain-containing protein [Mycobacterium sp.]|uniref:helix-turn-helix domain-containing protein n=1 Tax=Mycobacterium sp. TaxID=1785 RepID=UPI003D6BB32E